MFKLVKKQKHYILQFIYIVGVVGLGVFLVYISTACSAIPNLHDSGIVAVAAEHKGDPSLNVETSSISSDSDPFSWVWNDRPEVVTPKNNYYGGAKTWNLSEDLAIHMCWCYGIRVTHLNPEKKFNGENFDGHYVWSREDSHDIVVTDKINYIAVFDYENRLTKTFAKDGTRAYRFSDWSAYFFGDGEFNVTDNEGSIIVMEDGVFKIDPIKEWRFDVVPETLIHMDQQFISQLLINKLPWDN